MMPPVYAASRRHKIAVVHSYEKGYHDAGRYRRLLEKELAANGVVAEIREFFLNCDELQYGDELARASFFIDESIAWGADAIAIFNNQAVYSLLKCGNPKLCDVPVIFSGAYFPDEELIRKYRNVTGYVDIPDYARTVQMIERLVGNARIVVMSGSGSIDGKMWKQLVEQCDGAGIETFEGDVSAHVYSHRVIKDTDDEAADEFYNEK